MEYIWFIEPAIGCIGFDSGFHLAFPQKATGVVHIVTGFVYVSNFVDYACSSVVYKVYPGLARFCSTGNNRSIHISYVVRNYGFNLQELAEEAWSDNNISIYIYSFYTLFKQRGSLVLPGFNIFVKIRVEINEIR